MPKLEKIKDPFWDDKYAQTKVLGHIEVFVSNELFDAFLKQYAPDKYVYKKEDTQKSNLRKERLLKKVFKAAALTLTDRQFQIFTLRYVFGLKEMDIANQLDINQSYIPEVLKTSHYKIRKIMRLEAPRPRKLSKTLKVTKIAK